MVLTAIPEVVFRINFHLNRQVITSAEKSKSNCHAPTTILPWTSLNSADDHVPSKLKGFVFKPLASLVVHTRSNMQSYTDDCNKEGHFTQETNVSVRIKCIRYLISDVTFVFLGNCFSIALSLRKKLTYRYSCKACFMTHLFFGLVEVDNTSPRK